jgi:hypothetical protein
VPQHDCCLVEGEGQPLNAGTAIQQAGNIHALLLTSFGCALHIQRLCGGAALVPCECRSLASRLTG